MASSTGYVIAGGEPTRKFRAMVLAAVSVGPALIIVVDYLLTLLPTAPPTTVVGAVNVIIQGAVMAITAYATAPGASDQVIAAPPPPVQYAPAPPAIVAPVPIAPSLPASNIPAPAPPAPASVEQPVAAAVVSVAVTPVALTPPAP